MIIGLGPDAKKEILEILGRHVPGREIWAFGSRVAGRAKPFSDLDLVILGEGPVDPLVMAELREAFSESSLPFKVDIAEWAALDATFRRIILERHEVLVPPNS